MTAAEDLAVAVQLAALTGDRTDAEHKALLRVASRADRIINRQTGDNPHLPPSSGAGNLDRMPPCTYSDSHDRTCACRGDAVAVEPVAGWSRLVDLIEHTRSNTP